MHNYLCGNFRDRQDGRQLLVGDFVEDGLELLTLLIVQQHQNAIEAFYFHVLDLAEQLGFHHDVFVQDGSHLGHLPAVESQLFLQLLERGFGVMPAPGWVVGMISRGRVLISAASEDS